MVCAYAQKLYFYENIYYDSRKKKSLDIYWSVSHTGSLKRNMDFSLLRWLLQFGIAVGRYMLNNNEIHLAVSNITDSP